MAFSLRETGETVTALSLTLFGDWRLTGIGIGIEQRLQSRFPYTMRCPRAARAS